MPRETLASLKEEIARLQEASYRDTWWGQIAADEQDGIAPVAEQSFTDRDCHYTLTLWRPTGAVGGIVRSVMRCEGQRTSVSLYRLDDLYRARYATLDWRIAVERLESARRHAMGQGT